MKKKSFKICTTIIFFLFSIQSAFCDNLITPKPKPNLAKEKKDKYISGIIIPKFKPGTYVSEDQLELLKELEKEKEIVVKRVDGIIIPKNKPLIVHKKRLSTTKQSKYYKKHMPGDFCERVIPDPIPNSEVKPFCADGTLS